MIAEQREQWVLQHPELLQWWQSTKLPLKQFVEQNLKEIERRIWRIIDSRRVVAA
jgi:hypothetical protein